MFKVLENGKMPTRGSKYSAGVDLYASEDVVIVSGETVIVGLGVCVDLDKLIYENLNLFEMNFYESDEYGDNGSHYAVCGEKVDKFLNSHYLQLMLRSSLGKKCLIIPNGVGLIDLDYKDEIKVLIHNPVSSIASNIIAKNIVLATSLKAKGFSVADVEKVQKEVVSSLADELKKGDRIAQITLLDHKSYLFCIESDEVRCGGFGSTDVKF